MSRDDPAGGRPERANAAPAGTAVAIGGGDVPAAAYATLFRPGPRENRDRLTPRMATLGALYVLYVLGVGLLPNRRPGQPLGQRPDSASAPTPRA